jgi:hypothetical protein
VYSVNRIQYIEDDHFFANKTQKPFAHLTPFTTRRQNTTKSFLNMMKMKSRSDIDTSKFAKRGRNRRASSIPSGSIASSGSHGVQLNI